MSVFVKIRNLPINKLEEVCEWCVERYGPTSENRWRFEGLEYLVFDNEKDVTLFLLKWSGSGS